MHVSRNGQLFLTKIAVEDQPDVPVPEAAAGPPAGNFNTLGVAAVDLTAEMANRMGIPREIKGVVISNVTRNSLAEQSGIAKDMIVLQVNKTAVASGEAFRRAVEQSDREKGAVLQVLRPNGDVDFVILRLQ
jgi:S1-C subfamily serine protease